MWPWKKKSSESDSSCKRYAAIEYGYNHCRVPVLATNGYTCEKLGDFFVLGESDDGRLGNIVNSAHKTWFPLEGWTNAELRKLGFAVPDDGIAPQEILLARAVLSGDKAAAGALADWVTENWNKEAK